MSTPAWQRGPAPGWPGPEGWPTPPPAPSPSRAPLAVLIGLITALIVTCAVGAVLIARQRAEVFTATPSPASTGPAPTSPSPVNPSPTVPPPTSPTPAEPTASPSQPRPSPVPSPLRPSPTPKPTKPPKPGPQDWLSRNPLLDERMVSVACEQRVKPLPTSRKGFERYFGKLVDCAANSWRGPVEAAGLRLSRPSIVIYGGKVTTPCGNADPTYPAFYCPPNETIYSTTETFSGYLSTLRLGSYYLAFHEYAHHVQQRAKVLDNGWLLDLTPEQISRRVELQADCFSAVQLASTIEVTAADWADLQEWRNQAGDVIHGKSESQLFWLRRGLDTDRLARCNTWAAKGHLG